MKYYITETTRYRAIYPVSHFIREWRQYQQLSIEQLAAKVGLSTSMISQLERGKSGYTQSTLEKVADALDCEPWQLLACQNPGEGANLWRIALMLDRPAFQEVLKNYEKTRMQQSEAQIASD